MWGQFKDVVRRGLNIPDEHRTVLDDVLEHGNRALKQQQKNRDIEKAENDRLSGTPNYEPPQASVMGFDPTRGKGIFEKDKDTKAAWEKMGFHDLSQSINERFSTRSRDEAYREILQKYLTKKDVLDASRKEELDKDKNPFMGAGREYINNLLEERSNGKWLDEWKELIASKPKELERAKDEFGEMPDDRTPGEKARHTMESNKKRIETSRWSDDDIKNKAHEYADSEVYSEAIEGAAEGHTVTPLRIDTRPPV